MFLTPDNKIRWKLLGISTIFVVLIILAGVLWFDKPLFLFIRGFYSVKFSLFGEIFSYKNWLLVSAFISVMFYLKKTLDSGDNFKKITKRFAIGAFLEDFLQKTKTSYAFFIFCSVFFACAVIGVLKVLIGRARPVLFEALDITGFYPPSFDWVFNSMPSGHATATFAGLVMLGLLMPRAKPFTWTLATVVGLSRVVAGAHWPTDVILGAFVGMVAADLTKAFLKSRYLRF